MELLNIDCANRMYTPRACEYRTVEGVEYLHLVIEFCTRVVPPALEKISFYIWRPRRDDHWMLIPVEDLDRLKEYKFDNSVPPCGDEEAQVKHLDAMCLQVGDDVVMTE